MHALGWNLDLSPHDVQRMWGLTGAVWNRFCTVQQTTELNMGMGTPHAQSC
jgi:hypothetical protein